MLKFTSLAIVLALFTFACEKTDEPTPEDPIASFQFEIDAQDYLMVAFTNFSSNSTSYSWDFGDGNSSTDENPTHTYSATGDFTVKLTAANSVGTTSEFSQTITIVDPNEAFKMLTGEVSKTWKLYREGVSMSLGPDASDPAAWWEGLTNDGSRPCMYKQEFTFHFDGSYVFDDNGGFWAEYGVFNNNDCTDNITQESCVDVSGGTLLNSCGDDVSAWLSGTHAFTYEPSTGELTLTGEGAWIGIPKLGSTAETIVPLNEVSTKISIEAMDGYDVMTVEFIYEGVYWVIRYASYSTATEPDLVEAPPTCDPLTVISPTELSRTFASDAADQYVLLDTIASGSGIEYGIDDPADAGAAKVGKFYRIADVTYQELQFQVSPEAQDINFENMTTISLDVYLPSSNDYSGDLNDNVIIGFGETTCPPDWWTDNIEYHAEGVAKDEWVTLSFDISAPDYVAVADNGASPKDRNDLDMLYINIGGGDHNVGGEFYIRNLSVK